jgi:hypothetical protein
MDHRLIERLDLLIEEASVALGPIHELLPEGIDSPGATGRFFHPWRTRCLGLLESVVGSQSAYATGFREGTTDFHSFNTMIEIGVAILKEARLEFIANSMAREGGQMVQRTETQSMDVLLTWSGSASFQLADFFHSWLPGVLPGIRPWLSKEDIAKGKAWFPSLMEQLATTNTSITFVTPENIRSPWLYYEVGAIAAKLEPGAVCPYLVGVEDRFVKDTPIGQFQWTQATKDDSWRLIKSINARLIDGRHDERVLKGNYDSQWPRLKRALDKLAESLQPVREEVKTLETSLEERLSQEARQMLVQASVGSGTIMHVKGMDEPLLQIDGVSLLGDATPRTLATWKGALEELISVGLVESSDDQEWTFELNRKGYEIADLIKSRS